MKSAVIAGYLRSPFVPANKSPLAQVRPDEMVANVVRALVERSKVKVDDIEDLLLGCAFPEGEQGLNLAKLVAMIGRPAADRRRRHHQSLLWFLDAVGAFGGRRDCARCGRSLHLRRHREHEPRADDGLQPDAASEIRP